jgi:hypothetical protein
VEKGRAPDHPGTTQPLVVCAPAHERCARIADLPSLRATPNSKSEVVFPFLSLRALSNTNTFAMGVRRVCVCVEWPLPLPCSGWYERVQGVASTSLQRIICKPNTHPHTHTHTRLGLHPDDVLSVFHFPLTRSPSPPPPPRLTARCQGLPILRTGRWRAHGHKARNSPSVMWCQPNVGGDH